MISFFTYTGLSYLVAFIAAIGILSLPKLRMTNHIILWRIFFPIFLLCHLTIGWKLFEIVFEAGETYPIPAYFEAVSVLFMTWNCIGQLLFWIYTHLFSSGLPFDLEVQIPFALNSLVWAVVVTLLVVFYLDRKKKNNPNKSLNSGAQKSRAS